MSLSDDFLSNPLTFCTPRSAGGKGRILICAERDQVKLVAKAGYSSVVKRDRVTYCRIAQGVKIGQQMQQVELNHGADAVGAEIKLVPPVATDYGKRSGDWFPCFYLPWQAQGTYRMTLKKPSHFLEEPRLFFTSTVDGCSVIVEGSPETPTVYHLNDAGGGGAVPASTLLTDQQNYWTPKAATMEGRFQAAKSPKSVKAQAANPLAPALPGAKGVHALNYLDVAEANLPGLNTYMDQYIHAQRARAIMPTAVNVRFQQALYKPYGTVFGWKQNMTWRFFYQKRAVIFYMYRATDKAGAVTTVAVPRQCGFQTDEFWPNGSGVAIGKVLVP